MARERLDDRRPPWGDVAPRAAPNHQRPRGIVNERVVEAWTCLRYGARSVRFTRDERERCRLLAKALAGHFRAGERKLAQEIKKRWRER